MSEYGFRDTSKLPLFDNPTDQAKKNAASITTTDPEVLERKQKRKALIEAVFQRRREIYKRFYKKMRLQANSGLI